MWDSPEPLPPGHGERAGPGPMPRCPECSTVIDTYVAAGATAGRGRCPTHGLVTATYGGRDAIRAAYDKAKHEPYEIGASVEVEFPDDEWVTGTVEGYSHDDIDVVRIDVRLADGRFAPAAHPQHVRAEQ